MAVEEHNSHAGTFKKLTYCLCPASTLSASQQKLSKASIILLYRISRKQSGNIFFGSLFTAVVYQKHFQYLLIAKVLSFLKRNFENLFKRNHNITTLQEAVSAS